MMNDITQLTVTPEPPDRVQDGDGEEGRGATTDSGGWRTNLASLTSDIKHVLCDSYVKGKVFCTLCKNIVYSSLLERIGHDHDADANLFFPLSVHFFNT